MDFALYPGSLSKVSWTSTDYPTTPSTRSSIIGRRYGQVSTSNSPLTSTRTSPHTSLPANRSTDLSRLLTSGLRRSSSILSLSLFRSKSRAGNRLDGSIDEAEPTSRPFKAQLKVSNASSPRTRIEPCPPIPARPSERLYERSVLELVSDNAIPAGHNGAAGSPACLPDVNPPRQVWVQPLQRLGDLDPDKRGEPFARIQPDGWLKVIPKQWVEDDFSVDEVCTEDSRSVYSQDNSRHNTKVEDNLPDRSQYSTSLLWKNGLPPAPASGGRHQFQHSDTISVAERPTVPTRSRRRKYGSGILSDDEANTLVPAPLCLANQKNKSTVRQHAEHPSQTGAETPNKAASRRSSWTSILCDSQSDIDHDGQHRGGYDCVRRKWHAGIFLPGDGYHPPHQELADAAYLDQYNLIADIDEILDLYLTSDHKSHGRKAKASTASQAQQKEAISPVPTLSILQNLALENKAYISRFESAMPNHDSADRRRWCENCVDSPRLNTQPASGTNRSAHLGTSLCALCPKSRPQQQVTSNKDRFSSSPWPLQRRKHSNAYARAYQPRSRENKESGNEVEAGSPPTTATVTFLNGNGDTWI
ncbi:hypothetical protein LTR10_013189 [Elasticomyces elasticus]|uniref:GATA-type domain-containing protein n=1 Tax=Exophiala sideris TaxID=1016849 RepID=A0ABR0JB11_9EURO|nr:hypothetical protein LTR10_013189 [Elasticomyces elasticus]KAK5030564.1 hypothetical protein LTS07_005348 [Exophiala sideris]KAK5038618.1 hypothetical protein LTR13_004365 [Exophiala sideris]KAK5060499.1 hypothetical protein LTR69_005816 [Exophiala sideris]KAK5183411.1 hypothetical protein LTR44_004412 [Eurotiomycetes sp. CCFEE 6388]